ncbi:hypothetical protein DYB25_013942 [Aphanomyces astaci]|uniref:Uncharacterized protein n=1 Tax=Aphanomyces astaci TaxID=112090 RepID=A0A397C3M6_APHAT|nr:hypothetical protein DYB25_013942 [Aphanomyces astaci]
MEAALRTIAQVERGPDHHGLTLLIIDPQVDFHPGGSLAIPTANEDAVRTAAFIRAHTKEISQIIITLDSHQRQHIAHGVFWQDEHGVSPSPFTLILSSDVASGKWKPRSPELQAYAYEYTKALEEGGRFQLCIWPEHCIIGTPGQAIVDSIHSAALEWSVLTRRPIHYVNKGSNCFTESYSALRADIELPHDPSTSLNVPLVESLKKSNAVVVCGQARSHCVNFTVRDLINVWPAERASDIVVLLDCTSNVPGFESSGQVRLPLTSSNMFSHMVLQAFVDDMGAKGVRFIQSTTDDAFLPAAPPRVV